jgi:hypothetical protein
MKEQHARNGGFVVVSCNDIFVYFFREKRKMKLEKEKDEKGI